MSPGTEPQAGAGNHPASPNPFRLLAAVACYLGILLGTVVGVMTSELQGSMSAGIMSGLTYGIGVMLLVGTFCWLHVQNIKRFRQRRLRNGNRGRSPWGEVRTEEPAPYHDRLSGFLARSNQEREDGRKHEAGKHAAGAVAPPASMRTPTLQSRMPFWSLVDIPCDATEAKPAWFIRRVLMRIREAVTGRELSCG